MQPPVFSKKHRTRMQAQWGPVPLSAALFLLLCPNGAQPSGRAPWRRAGRARSALANCHPLGSVCSQPVKSPEVSQPRVHGRPPCWRMADRHHHTREEPNHTACTMGSWISRSGCAHRAAVCSLIAPSPKVLAGEPTVAITTPTVLFGRACWAPAVTTQIDKS